MSTPTHPDSDDVILTWEEITDLGLEEAPADAGPTWEEIRKARRRGRTNDDQRH